MPKITTHNVETGEIVERDMTAAEQAEFALNESKDAAKMAERVKAITAKQAVIDKLGLTVEEVTALLA
jgi:hypothetical protein